MTASAVKTTMVGKKDPYSNSEVIMTAQRKLQAKGYYSGVVDGIAGPQTQSGLREFQGDEKLKVTGRLNKATAKALEMDLVR